MVAGLGLGGFVIWQGLKLKLGTIHEPGSGFLLFYIGILMCLFAVSIIVSSLTEGGPTLASRWENVRWTKPLLVAVNCLIGYVLLVIAVGIVADVFFGIQ